MAIADELIALLGYELTGQENLKKFENGLDRARNKVASFAKTAMAMGTLAVGALTGAVGGMLALAKEAAGPLDELIKVADRTGVAFDALQEWRFAAGQSGASSGEFTGAVQSLSRQLAEAARGTGRAKKALEDYGLSATDASGDVKSATDFMSEMANKMQDLSEAQALDLGGKLGMSPAMVTLLRSGNEEIEKLRRQARDSGLVFTEEDARNAEAFNDQMALFNQTVTAMRHMIGVQFLPVLKDMMESIQNWVMANQELIKQNIVAWTRHLINAVTAGIEALHRFGRALSWVVGRFSDLLSTFSQSDVDLSTLQGLAGIAALLLRVFMPMVFYVGLAALALDDFLAYLEGGESVIGNFIEWLRNLIPVSGEVGDAIANLAAAIGVGLAAAFVLKPFAITGIAVKLVASISAAIAPLLLAGLTGLSAVVVQGFTAAFALLSNPIGWAIILAGVAAALIAFFWDDLVIAWEALREKAIELFTQLGDWFLSIDWAGIGSQMMNAIWDGMKAIGENIKAWFAGLFQMPDWVKSLLGDDGPGAQPVDPSVYGTGESPAVNPDFTPVEVDGDAWDYKMQLQQQEWERMLENASENLQRLAPDTAVDATITDARTDARTFPMTNNVTVNQTVTQATNAPAQAANATGKAVQGAVADQRSQIETEPSF